MIAELLGGQVSGAQMDAAPLHARAASIAATDHVGEIEPFAGEFGDLCTGLHEFLGEALFFGCDTLTLARLRIAITAFHAGKNGPQAVILLLRDGIELVVVAACAIHRHGHRGGERLRGHVVEIERTRGAFEHVALRFHLAHKIPRTCGEKAGSDDALRIIRRDDIARDLLAKELVVGLVGVQRIDDVVAIAPRIRAEFVALKAVRVRVMRDVEPVACPAFAVVLAG